LIKSSSTSLVDWRVIDYAVISMAMPSNPVMPHLRTGERGDGCDVAHNVTNGTGADGMAEQQTPDRRHVRGGDRLLKDGGQKITGRGEILFIILGRMRRGGAPFSALLRD
jgi:hypothetical protein